MTTHHPYWAPPEAALHMFAHAPSVHFAGASASGQPIARTFTAVMVDGVLCFHCGNKGEKLGLIDQRVIAFAEEVVAQVPSYWVHPALACPVNSTPPVRTRPRIVARTPRIARRETAGYAASE